MNLSKAKPLVFNKGGDADGLRLAAKGIVIPTVALFATTGDGAIAIIRQAKAKRVKSTSKLMPPCFAWPLEVDLLKGKVDGTDTAVLDALKRETAEEGGLDWDAHQITPRFEGWIKVPCKKHKHGEFRGLDCKLWLSYLLILPSRNCLRPGSHGVASIEWHRELKRCSRRNLISRLQLLR